MNNNFDNVEEMKELIIDELSECEFDSNFRCEECSELEQCYCKASSCNSEWAKSIDYGGCDTEEEFWEQLFD